MATVLTSQHTGETRIVPTGFSWTTLFFGPFPALFRGDVMWALIMMGTAFISMGLAWLVWPFAYNGLHVKRLIEKGFRPGSNVHGYAVPAMQQHVHVNVAPMPHGVATAD